MKRVLLYTSPWDARPGETVDIHVSLLEGAAYELDVTRVVCGDAGLGLDLRPMPTPIAGIHAGSAQRTAIGSCMVVDPAPSIDPDAPFAIEMWLWPTLPGRGAQMIAERWQDGEGFALELGPARDLVFRVGGVGGTAELATGVPVPERRWTFIRAAFDPASGRMDLYQETQARPPAQPASAITRHLATPLRALGTPAVPLNLAASAERGGGRFTTRHYNGKLAAPRLSSGGTIAAWDFAPEGDITVRDPVGGYHGRFVNLPDRAVTGPDWRADAFDPRLAPGQWNAIHFHEDDLYDARWSVSHRLTIPADWPSGYYTVRVSAGGDTSYAPVFVLPPRGRATAPVAVLASTLTTIAYANYQFHLRVAMNEVSLGRVPVLTPEDVYLRQTPDLGISTYDLHADGSPGRWSTRLRPVLNNQPGGEAWNLNADTHLLAWLDHIGQQYDLITDEALHAEGADLLARYRVVLTGSHPEYWTTPMWDAMETWLGQGGRLMYLGGNGFYWRAGVDPDWPGAVEVRRAESGARHVAETPGDHHMASTGEPGGLWRRLGRTPNALVGGGFRGIGFDGVGHYRRTPAAADPRAAWLLDGVKGETFGAMGLLGSAASGEVDATDAGLGTPPHALVIAASEGHTANMQPAPEDILMPHPAMSAPYDPAIRAEMVFFETLGGGAVFTSGSLNWVSALPLNDFDNDAATITANALRCFLDGAPFILPGTTSQ